MKSLPCTIWKTTRKIGTATIFCRSKKWSLSLFLFSLFSLFSFFLFSHTAALAAGAGSVFFRFPAEWQKAKEEDIEIKKEAEKPAGKSIPKITRRRRRKKSSPFRPKPKNFMDWRLSGSMLNRAYLDTVFNDSMEDRYEIHSRYIVENKVKLPKYNVSGAVSVDLRYDTRGNGGAHSKFAPLLREAWGEIRERGLRVRLGRQNVTWGKLDDFTLLDIVNPQDYTESILIDKKMRKTPVLMAKIDYFAEDGQYIESFFAPRFRPNKIDFFGSDWAVFRYLKEDAEESDYTQAIKDMVAGVRIEDGDELKNSLKNFETGLRYGGRGEGYDYSFYYMYIHDRFPALRSDSGLGSTVRELLYNPNADTLVALANAVPNTDDLKLVTDYNRMHVLGSDFETTIANLGVRGEVGLFLSPSYLTNDFSLTERATFSAGVGVDHTTADDLYLNFQFIEDVILNYEGLFDAEQFGHQLVGTISKDFLRGRLVPAFYFGYNFSYKDYFLNPKISYTWSGPHGAFILTAGAFLFEGKASTALGRFDKNDLLYTTAEYKF